MYQGAFCLLQGVSAQKVHMLLHFGAVGWNAEVHSSAWFDQWKGSMICMNLRNRYVHQLLAKHTTDLEIKKMLGFLQLVLCTLECLTRIGESNDSRWPTDANHMHCKRKCYSHKSQTLPKSCRRCLLQQCNNILAELTNTVDLPLNALAFTIANFKAAKALLMFASIAIKQESRLGCATTQPSTQRTPDDGKP